MLQLNIQELRKALCKQKFGTNWTSKIAEKVGVHKSTVSRTISGKTTKKETTIKIYKILVPEELRAETPLEKLFPEIENEVINI